MKSAPRIRSPTGLGMPPRKGMFEMQNSKAPSTHCTSSTCWMSRHIYRAWKGLTRRSQVT
jgi:hypothetical protein